MIVYGIKIERISRPDLKPSYFKGKNGETEMTSIISYAKLFQIKDSAENKMYILQQYYKNCSDLKFSVVDIEIKEI